MKLTDLPRGTVVSFPPTGRARATAGIVGFRHLNPNRKPGIGRVSYTVSIGQLFYPIKIAAAKLTIVTDIDTIARVRKENRQ